MPSHSTANLSWIGLNFGSTILPSTFEGAFMKLMAMVVFLFSFISGIAHATSDEFSCRITIWTTVCPPGTPCTIQPKGGWHRSTLSMTQQGRLNVYSGEIETVVDTGRERLRIKAATQGAWYPGDDHYTHYPLMTVTSVNETDSWEHSTRENHIEVTASTVTVETVLNIGRKFTRPDGTTEEWLIKPHCFAHFPKKP